MGKALMTGYYEAYNSEDPERVAAFLHQDVVLLSPQGEIKGRAAYLDTYRLMTSSFTDRMTPLSIDEEGEAVRVEIDNRLTAKKDIDDFMGQKIAQGQAIDLQLTGRYRISEGLITRIEIAMRAQ